MSATSSAGNAGAAEHADDDSEVFHSKPNGSGGDSSEEDLDDIALMDSLRQLKHNYHKLQTEKKDMQRYCEEMEDTMEKKEQMVNHLKEHNTVLSRKLSKAQQNTQDIIDLERKLEAQKAESRQRRRKLPTAPQRTPAPGTNRVMPGSPSRVTSTNPEILQAKIGSLEAKCRRLQDDLDEAMHKTAPRPEGDDVAVNGDDRELPHALSIATEYEKAQEQWEEERQELKATLHQTTEELCALEKVVLETQDLLEETTVQLRSTEVELNLLRRMSRADADTSLADELSGSMHNAEAVQALADLALLREQLVKNQGQLDVARQERDEFSARLEARRLSSEAERKESDQRISLLEMEIVDLKQQLNGDDYAEAPADEKKGMTKQEQAQILKEKVLLKMQLDDVQTSLIDSKAEAAKAQWEQELFKLYVRNRDRIIHQILSRPTLSKKDRRIIASIVDETTPSDNADAPWRRGISALTHTLDATPGKSAPSQRKISKVQIGSPVVSTFRKIDAPTALGENWSEMLPEAEGKPKE
eukprot:m.314162 g.314162  ORF g.314162 m.314162 type:complete len:529 (+) comp20264_c0_seq2:193-1779(+)